MNSGERTDYLVLGNGAAAVHAVEAIRRLDRAGRIVLLAREPEHAYSRPLITYRLGGKVDDAAMDYRGRDFYNAHGVEARLGLSARRVDARRRVVECRDAPAVAFEQLLIGTGGTPIRPDAPGMDLRGVFSLTTWADERAVEEFLAPRGAPRGAVVLGGGLIGLKTVEALLGRGIDVSVVELADRILSATFDRQASRLAEQALAGAGAHLRTRTTIRSVEGTDRFVTGVTLADGTRIDCDLLIVAIGVRPDLSLVTGSDIRTDRGILVDERLATSAEGIFAAGDVAQAADALTGQPRPIPILPAAARQGRIAGTNMAGGDACYDGGLAMNAVDVAGVPTISVGMTVESPGDEVLSRLDEKTGVYRKIVLRDNRVIGAIFIGDIERAGIFTGLIRARLDVGPVKGLLLADEFGLLSLPGDYRAHMVSGTGIEV